MSTSPRTFGEFWPEYVNAHRQPLTRGFHFVGTTLGWILVVVAILVRNPWFILGALVVPYGLAWFSHFFVEHNRPATFGHPFWSWAADQKMCWTILRGSMQEELRRAGKATS
jgi:hypothetical protein